MLSGTIVSSHPRLPRLFDCGENLGARRGIKLVAVEAKEQAFADGYLGGLRILLPQGRFHECPRRFAHRAPHDEALFSRPSHAHGPITLRDIRRCIMHGVAPRDTAQSALSDSPTGSGTHGRGSSPT